MNLFRQPFFNRRNWILENLEELDLTLEEAMVVLFIDYFNEFNRNVDIASLSKKLHMDGNHIDAILSKLLNKGYLMVIYEPALIFKYCPLLSIPPLRQSKSSEKDKVTPLLFQFYKASWLASSLIFNLKS